MRPISWITERDGSPSLMFARATLTRENRPQVLLVDAQRLLVFLTRAFGIDLLARERFASEPIKELAAYASDVKPRDIEKAMLALLSERGTATACPSEVARAICGTRGWRAQMPAVRAAAIRLQARGKVDVYQRGRSVQLAAARGPVRLRSREVVTIDYRAHPERYVIGRGEQGVLTVEPYKSALLPLWRFRTPAIARVSAVALFDAFERYRDVEDFVGMDMTRKFLQMGITRARRYANHKGGHKYDGGRVRPKDNDAEKAAAAEAFRPYFDRVRQDPTYQRLRTAHLGRDGR